MFEQISKECGLVLFNNLVYLAEANGYERPSVWVVEKLDALGVETTTSRQDDNSLTLIRSKGYTQEIHNQILAELDPQMTPEAMAEAFNILVANAASTGRSKDWVELRLTDAGATFEGDFITYLTTDHIIAVENKIEEAEEAEQKTDEELQIAYKALEARAELAGLSSEALSQNHGAINPDYELTPFVIAELSRHLDAWVNAFGGGENVAVLNSGVVFEVEAIEAEQVSKSPKPIETITSSPMSDVIAENGGPSAGQAIPGAEPVKKKGRKAKRSAADCVARAIVELNKALVALSEELDAIEGGENV